MKGNLSKKKAFVNSREYIDRLFDERLEDGFESTANRLSKEVKNFVITEVENELHGYADEKDGETLKSAKAYTDDNAPQYDIELTEEITRQGVQPAELKLKTKKVTDEEWQDVNAVNVATTNYVGYQIAQKTDGLASKGEVAEAKQYADTQAESALESAKQYADSLSDNYATAEQGKKADKAIQLTDELILMCDTSVGELFEIFKEEDDEPVAPLDPGEDIPIITE